LIIIVIGVFMSLIDCNNTTTIFVASAIASVGTAVIAIVVFLMLKFFFCRHPNNEEEMGITLIVSGQMPPSSPEPGIIEYSTFA
jgi:hypothetical protein